MTSQQPVRATPESSTEFDRIEDALAGGLNPEATFLRLQIEQWTLDEAPLAAALFNDIHRALYCEDRLRRGTLDVGDRRVRLSDLDAPTLAVANVRDDVAPPAAMRPFLEAIAATDERLIEYPGDAGVVLQLGVLLGRTAHAVVWPELVRWIGAHEAGVGAPALASGR